MMKEMEETLVVREMDTDIDTLIALSSLSEESVEAVGNALRVNVLTIQQVSLVTGKSVSSIESCLRSTPGEETILTPVFPFPSGDKKGPKFILRDSKFETFINKLLNAEKNRGRHPRKKQKAKVRG